MWAALALIGLGAGGFWWKRKKKKKGGGGYQGPRQYAHYFDRHHPQQVVDQAIVELTSEARAAGWIGPDQTLKWDWDNLIRIRTQTPVTHRQGVPFIRRITGAVAVAFASGTSQITVANNGFVYDRSLWLHEFGHLLLEANGISGGPGHHHQLPFFRRHGQGAR